MEFTIKSDWSPTRNNQSKEKLKELPFAKLQKGEYFDVPATFCSPPTMRTKVAEENKKDKNSYCSMHLIKDANKKVITYRIYRKI